MSYKKGSPWLILAALILWAIPSAAVAADVDVFAEGAYSFNRTSPATTGKLVVYIYANINITDPLNFCASRIKASERIYATSMVAAQKR